MNMLHRRIRREAARSVPSYLVVACASEAASVMLMLDTLPVCAHGQVFLVDDEHTDAGRPEVSVPLRFGVTWLATGEAAERAVHAWASEMLCEGDAHEGFQTRVSCWFSRRMSDVGERFRAGHLLPDTAVHVGERFSLSDERS